MNRLAFSTAAVVLGALAAGAGETITFQGLDVGVVGAERVKVFRDLKVKDPKKQDLLVVRLEVRWTAEIRHILIKEKDLAVKDERGKTHDCALDFVQASAPTDGAPTTLEVPFHLKTDAAVVSLRLGKTWLSLESAPAGAPAKETPRDPSAGVEGR
jgi:hypothetical protein